MRNRLRNLCVLSMLLGACGGGGGATDSGLDAGADTGTRTLDTLPSSEDLALPGLNGAVEVVFDDRGVPHIYGTTLHDVFMVEGYLMSRDRFAQMEFIRRNAIGRLAEVAGGADASLVARDQGNLTTDLKISLAPWFTGPQPPPVSAGIYVNGQFLGEVRVADVARAIFDDRAQQDDLAWSQAEPQACGSQKAEPACARVRAYIATFPTGHHLEEAHRLIQSLTPQQPVVAQDAGPALLQRAVTAAQSAANIAANKVREKAQKSQQKALLKSEEDAAAAGKVACVATCKKVCEEPLGSQQKGVSPQSVAECKSTCAEEACP